MTLISYITQENVVLVGALNMKLLFFFQNADGSIMDISGAAEKKCRIQKPDGTTVDHDLTFETNGINGEAYWLTIAGDIDQEEWYEVNAWVSFLGSFEGWALPVKFRAISPPAAPA